MKKKRLLEEKVFSYMRKHHMLEAEERVIAGISGGADSVCLLFVLLEWAKQVPMELAVVHVNHGIRAEASEDAAYVKGLCDRFGLPFYLKEIDVRRKAVLEKCSEEEAGRKARYEAFAEAAKDFGASKIAVAHNSNDRSETMLFHLFRGSGIKGLGSIQPVRDNIIRPILCLERKEIEDYLRSNAISYCEDVTNAGDDYTRNRIRHHILPYAEEHIAGSCVSHMARTAELLSETEDYLEQETQAIWKECVIRETNAEYEIDVEKLLSNHAVLQKRLLHIIIKRLSPQQKDISYIHVTELLDLFHGEGNRSVDLPFGIQGKREYTKVVVGIVREDALSEDDVPKDIVIELPKELPEQRCSEEYIQKSPTKPIWSTEVIMGQDYKMLLELFPVSDILKKGEELPQNQYTKWLDYDKIKGYLMLRTRGTGDYFTISNGSGGVLHKSLKDYMITEKIPKEMRGRIPLLAEGNHVLWLVGYRISEHYKVKENTKYILQVTFVNKDSDKG